MTDTFDPDRPTAAHEEVIGAIEAARIRDEERRADRAGTYPGSTYLAEHVSPTSRSNVTEVIADQQGGVYNLNPIQADRVKAAALYTSLLNEHGAPNLAELLDAIGFVAVDENMLDSSEFCTDRKLRALYAVELIKTFGEIRALVTAIDTNDRSYLDGVVWAIYGATFDDASGTTKKGLTSVDTPSLIHKAQAIINDFCGNGYKDPVKKTKHIREVSEGMSPGFRVINDKDGMPTSVLLEDMNNTQRRSIGATALQDVRID